MDSEHDFWWDEGLEGESSARGPIAADPGRLVTNRPVSTWLETGLVPFFWAALAGLVLSFVAHVSALLGLPQPLGAATMMLHLGVFIVWFPAVMEANRMVGPGPRWDYWRVVLSGCPRWARWCVYGLFAYAMFNFFRLVPALGASSASRDTSASGDVLVFSGHWMAFYSAAAGILYSAVQSAGTQRCCPNGHRVPRSAFMCEVCGLPVLDPASRPERDHLR